MWILIICAKILLRGTGTYLVYSNENGRTVISPVVSTPVLDYYGLPGSTPGVMFCVKRQKSIQNTKRGAASIAFLPLLIDLVVTNGTTVTSPTLGWSRLRAVRPS